MTFLRSLIGALMKGCRAAAGGARGGVRGRRAEENRKEGWERRRGGERGRVNKLTHAHGASRQASARTREMVELQLRKDKHTSGSRHVRLLTYVQETLTHTQMCR